MTTLFVVKSSNAKTGPIPVTYSARSTCPTSCPHYRDDCYAEDYYTSLAWNRVDNGAGDNWADLCAKVSALTTGTLWRHNVAGDLPGDDESIDATALGDLVKANIGRRGYTYSHKKSADAITWIRHANQWGFAVNLSADDAGEADTLADLCAGPVVCVVPVGTPAKSTTPAGRRIVICPAQTRDDTTCKTCGLCSVTNRQSIIGFIAHGRGAKAASARASRVIPIALA